MSGITDLDKMSRQGLPDECFNISPPFRHNRRMVTRDVHCLLWIVTDIKEFIAVRVVITYRCTEVPMIIAYADAAACIPRNKTRPTCDDTLTKECFLLRNELPHILTIRPTTRNIKQVEECRHQVVVLYKRRNVCVIRSVWVPYHQVQLRIERMQFVRSLPEAPVVAELCAVIRHQNDQRLVLDTQLRYLIKENADPFIDERHLTEVECFNTTVFIFRRSVAFVRASRCNKVLA